MMCRDQGRLEHPMPAGTVPAGDGSFPSKCSTVVCDWRQARECRSLLTSRPVSAGSLIGKSTQKIYPIPSGVLTAEQIELWGGEPFVY